MQSTSARPQIGIKKNKTETETERARFSKSRTRRRIEAPKRRVFFKNSHWHDDTANLAHTRTITINIIYIYHIHTRRRTRSSIHKHTRTRTRENKTWRGRGAHDLIFSLLFFDFFYSLPPSNRMIKLKITRRTAQVYLFGDATLPN